TQYYGRYARPGGGIYVLERPGVAMDCRELAAAKLPAGNYMHPSVTYDGKRVLFAFCQADAPPANSVQGQHGRWYHLYEVRPDGTGLRQLTDGGFDDFAPRELPDRRLVFSSTRRGGWHRCGNPGCETYTITTCEADGANPRPLSVHETNEWDPAVLSDGRLVYTRWDYVDRHPVFFEQLWSMHPDGSRQGIYFGNNTFNPVGIWEPQAVPGSPKVMAVAGAHHAMTAGSVILVDVRRGVDGLAPLTRVTPEVPFPESEAPVAPVWYSPQPGVERVDTEAARRWPGSCYKSPWPLSEDVFLAAWSYQPLVGEPQANAPAQFGLYLVDRYGNRELLHRDPRISSVWPVPLRPRERPPVLPSLLDPGAGEYGVYVLENVYEAAPSLPEGAVMALRIVQVLPKSTPGIDNPPVGLPRGAPGKQVLGTVPVESDGSAHFRVPARVELAFQALDERGVALQTMRSGAMLQPGEKVTCVGCHDPRTATPRRGKRVAALGRAPSTLAPGPDGSRPLSYPLLVQPVLDRACVSCHGAADPAGGIPLTGQPEGHYTVSYNRLAPLVPFSDQGNAESLSRPGRFGAQRSPLTRLLFGGHHDVKLNRDELDRLVTWMDVNVLFYGTFDPADQARQLRAERIAGPGLE
ncbi:MAG: PD40 domain-containing protein, partial [Armatimonadetes bacterium]|nr:PD40 domain-containing protein [Armatimonadota bacterium]